MLAWFDRLIGIADDVRPEEARHLVRMAVISVTFAILWMLAVSPVAKGAVAWAPALGFGSVAFVTLAIAIIRVIASNQAVLARVQLQLRDPVLAGHHIGCRVGRRRLECGLLSVTATTSTLPVFSQVDSVHDADDVVLAEAADGRFGHEEMYEALGNALQQLIERAAARNEPIASIGIAVPGGVNPQHGTFAGKVHGAPFDAHEDVSKNVATLLTQKCGKDVLRRVFPIQDPASLTKLIHLDNDARCAARWLITAEEKWADFACIFAGTGVGSGLIFDRHVFYGAGFRAGEVGHVNLNTGDRLLLGGKTLEPRECSCGQRGYHFESLVSIGGLGLLARALDPQRLQAVLDSYTADAERAAATRRSGPDPDEAAGMVLLRTLHMPDEQALKIIGTDPEVKAFLVRVTQLYGQLFSIGIAAILNALDLPHVALCGTIPEFLGGNSDFVWALTRNLAGNVVGSPVHPDFFDMREIGWRGAALLPRDPDYVKRRAS
jgi:predicted NBD/HSP70 family sugar kinase